jgi:hypothetical protein
MNTSEGITTVRISVRSYSFRLICILCRRCQNNHRLRLGLVVMLIVSTCTSYHITRLPINDLRINTLNVYWPIARMITETLPFLTFLGASIFLPRLERLQSAFHYLTRTANWTTVGDISFDLSRSFHHLPPLICKVTPRYLNHATALLVELQGAEQVEGRLKGWWPWEAKRNIIDCSCMCSLE